MTWEEIIIKIRKEPEYKALVELAYFEEDLRLNVDRFKDSEEFRETCRLIKEFTDLNSATSILDVGAGNGIASVAFALMGCKVSAVEPDPSKTIGNGAISILKEQYNLPNLHVDGSYGEKLPFNDNHFDIVYIRQAMHHAHHLNNFISECARVLKPKGLLLTVRDHVVLDQKDKEWFLEAHLLHKYYGGENAFTYQEYSSAFKSAGLKIKKVLRHYDSVINYFPEQRSFIEEKKNERTDLINKNLKKKLPFFIAENNWVRQKYRERLERSLGKELDENLIPGRMISFFAVK